jgi:phosphoserine phosphatase RsbU/P
MIPKTRMGKFTAILLVLWVPKAMLISDGLVGRLPPLVQFLLDLPGPLLGVPAIYYSWKSFSLVRRKLLWKIRRRLILAHIFIGAIPIAVILVIGYVSGLLFYYQLSYFLVSNQIGIHTAQIHAFNNALRTSLLQALPGGPPDPVELKAILDRDSKYLLASYPSASIILRYQDNGAQVASVIGNANVRVDQLPAYQVPRWTWDRDFSGLVLEDTQPQLYVTRDAQRQSHAPRLYLRSLVLSDFNSELPFSIEVSVPFDRYLLERLKATLGQDLLLANGVPVSGLNVMLQSTDILRTNIETATFELGNTGDSVGRPVWSILLFPTSWNSGIETSSGQSDVLFIELSTAKLFHNVFQSENNVSRTILGVLRIVVGFFLILEIFSLIAGILLTKSITNAVHNLDRGTEFVKRGIFSHRVIVKSDDQLGALAASFNQMTEYVQTLVKERVQKERLERELEIAKEVQEQLFPRGAPTMRRMEVTGVCLPARVVSGDYYDFLPFGPDRLGMALGDICGKGISAALLMANLQATLRSNLMHSSRSATASSGSGVAPRQDSPSVAGIVYLLNQQIYNSTSANKYASFFYAVYDDTGPALTYCNAGHNPPLHFSGDTVRRLSTGGTVVGIFPDAEFEEETIRLSPGDLFLAYTDGISESVNEYGEEFGEERLIGLVRAHRQLSAQEMQNVIVENVLGWAYNRERDDDMTLLVARVL